MKKFIFFRAIVLLSLFETIVTYANELHHYPINKSIAQIANIAPTITAVGNQIYCSQTYIKIVTDITISDPDDTTAEAIYIQISSGYIYGQDQLRLTGLHPSIITSWDIKTGKLKLYSPYGLPILYDDFVSAIKDVEYNNSSVSASGTREFSISIGEANYLPSTDHYYEFVSDLGITWTNAKLAAENRTYYGLQGYLATISDRDEALFVGKQASGTGWIGGTDEESEGVWKWVTGPERGTVFWNGAENGSTPNFAFWNNSEPNNLNKEDYAHITAPSIGILGTWNDLANSGSEDGPYQPKGYIVEYGGMPDDPILQISASTTITILSEPILSSNRHTCNNTAITINAEFPDGILNWYSVPTGGDILFTGTTFTSPNLIENTSFYYDYGCQGRKSIAIQVIQTPTIISTNNPINTCAGTSITLEATPSSGTINWYTTINAQNIEATGKSITIPDAAKNSTYYAEAIESNCSNKIRIPVLVTIYELPNVSDEEITICEGKPITLNAGVSNMKYLWSTGETTQVIRTKVLNDCSVTVTSPAPQSCSKTKNFNIIQIQKPSINDVMVNESVVTIITTLLGDFEYSIDGITYQNSNIFTIENGGLYTAHVKDKNNCGKDSESFVVLSYPKFFTPNNDGENDSWTVKGMENFPSAVIEIYDRYGKLIANLNPRNLSWNGTFNGKQLPSEDYWYVAKINDLIPQRRGHFSLKR